MIRVPALLVALALVATLPARSGAAPGFQEFKVNSGAHPHDVAPAPDGSVWYTAQFQGALGKLDPASGQVRQIALGRGSAPHGVVVGPDGAPWVTDGGLNAIVRVDPKTEQVTVYPLPSSASGANLNTACFDRRGVLWFTGQSGYYGRLDPSKGPDRMKVEAWAAPRGYGPYGITATPDGAVFYASLAGNHIAQVDPATGKATPIDPPTRNQGARRVWSDSKGNVWVSYWNAGKVGRYDPHTRTWKEWALPGSSPNAYAVYVDDRDQVWLSEWSANAIVHFDPQTERFESFPLPSSGTGVRQILGRPGEVWLPGSGIDQLLVLKAK